MFEINYSQLIQCEILDKLVSHFQEYTVLRVNNYPVIAASAAAILKYSGMVNLTKDLLWGVGFFSSGARSPSGQGLPRLEKSQLILGVRFFRQMHSLLFPWTSISWYYNAIVRLMMTLTVRNILMSLFWTYLGILINVGLRIKRGCF